MSADRNVARNPLLHIASAVIANAKKDTVTEISSSITNYKMDIQHKTNEQLQLELLELRQDYNSLKESHEKEDSIRKHEHDEMLETNLKSTLAMQGGNMAWWEMDVPTGNVTFGKHKVEMLGYEPENFTHYKDFTALVHPKDLKRIMNAMKGHLDGTLAKYEAEYRILTSSGEYIWFFDYGSVVKRDPDGKPLIVTGFVYNITEKKQAEEILLKSENMLQMILDNFPGVVFWKDRQSNYLGCNQSFASGAGLKSPAEIVGKTDLEMPWASTEANNYRKDDINVMEHGKESRHIIETHHQSNGKLIWFDTSKFPLRDSIGQIIGVVGVSNDISTLRKAEQTLKDSEVKFRQIFDLSPFGIVLTGLDKKFLNCNQAFAKMLGYAAEEIVGLSFDEITFPEDILVGNSAMKALINGKVKELQIIKRYVRKDKQLIWANLTISLIRDNENVPLYFFANLQDITKLKKTEEERDRIIAINEQSSDFIGTSDMHGNLLYHNPAAKAIMGMSANASLVGMHIKDVCATKFLDLILNKGIPTAIRDGKWESEIALKHFEGHEIPVSILLMVHKDKDGIPAYLSAVMRDITNMKLAEINLKKKTEKIEAQNKDYIQINNELAFQNQEKENRTVELSIVNIELEVQNNEIQKYSTELIIANKELAFQNEEKEKQAVELIIAKEHAEQSDRLKTAFMNNISHEIRTPLNAILGFAPFIIEPDITMEEKEAYLEIINFSSDRLMNTITDIMDISLIISGNMEVHPQPIDISSLLVKVFKHFQEPCKGKNLELKMQFPYKTDPVILNTDGEILRKAVSKLVDNSVKFTKEGSITLGFELINNEIEFFVTDTGKGIEKDAQELIYKYYMQEDVSSTRGHEGSGLGLSIAKGMIQLLAGQDAFQMSGIFIIGPDGRIRLPYYYDDIADHPPVELLMGGVMGMNWSTPFDSPIEHE